MSGSGWIGVDFDGTLAEYDSKDFPALGAPIAPMVERVKRWLAEGRQVRIVTARVSGAFSHAYSAYPATPEGRQDIEEAQQQMALIQDWCRKYIGQPLVVTAVKDYRMAELWDDRAISVENNTGRVLTAGHPEAAP